MAAGFDLTSIRQLKHGRACELVQRLKVGGEVTLTFFTDEALIITNGQVVAVDDSGVYVDCPRLQRSIKRLVAIHDGSHAVNAGKPVRRNQLRHRAAAHVIERYAGGQSCQVSGKVEAIIADAFMVGGQWFDFGPKQDGKRRKMTIMGGQ